MIICGLLVDTKGRCVHYHGADDVAVLQCAQCHRFYGCYQCHDELEDHHFKPMPISTAKILCANCMHLMSYAQYQKHSCPFCHHALNPKCDLHHEIYFQA